MRASSRACRSVALASLAVSLALAGRSAAAATRTWNGTSSTNWSDGANWTPAGAPLAGDDLVFPGGASNLSNTNDLAPATSFPSITFNGTSGGYNLGGNAIQLGAGGITANNTSGFNVVTFNITLTASQTFSLPAELDLNGNLDLGANDLVVGGSGSTSFFQGVISGTGSLTKNGTATLVYAGTSPNTLTGTTTVNGGTLRLNKPSGVVAIGGALVIGDGLGNDIVSLANDQQIGDFVPVTINSSGTLDFATFGAMNERIGSLAGSGNVNTGTGTLSTGVNNASTTFSGVIGGNGFVIKEGTGTMTLTGADTHNGTTNVTLGTLIINGSEVLVNVVGPLARLGGTGTISFLGGVAGTVAPGVAGPGILSIGADAQILAGMTLAVELNGPAVGTGYDQLNVVGTVTLGGNLDVSLGFVPLPGSTFTIVNNSGTDPVVGTFAGLPEGATFTAGSTTFQISYVGGTGNDVVLTALTGATPTPTSTPRPTLTPTTTSTASPTLTPTATAPPAQVPTLSISMMLLLVLALAGAAVLLMRRAS